MQKGFSSILLILLAIISIGVMIVAISSMRQVFSFPALTETPAPPQPHKSFQDILPTTPAVSVSPGQ